MMFIHRFVLVISVLFCLFGVIESFRSSSRYRHIGKLQMAKQYCEDNHRTKRRPTRTVTVGDVLIGSEYDVVKQTMTTTSTDDVEASVEQILKIAKEGGQMVRLTVQGKREANACAAIRESLWEKGSKIPLVADIHFMPKTALQVADAWEKIRVNPGNFADGFKKFEDKVYETREEYDEPLEFMEDLFKPLVLKCKELNRAIRIGTNHGSLSARVMSYWGDSPVGMVESAKEFAEMCRRQDFHNFLFSMKASNPMVMVQAYRLLAAEMYRLGWNYPMHLGVTEAGEGEDGRMKSAIGIGALLADGLGDTIRVSLTEDPEYELLPCKTLISLADELYDDSKYEHLPSWTETKRDFENFEKRRGELPGQLAEDQWDIRGIMHRDGSVFTTLSLSDLSGNSDVLYNQLGAKLVVGMPFKDIATSDSIYLPEVPSLDDKESRKVLKRLQDVACGIFAPYDELKKKPFANSIAVINLSDIYENNGFPELPEGSIRWAIKMTGLEDASVYQMLKENRNMVTTTILEVPTHTSRIHASRRAFQLLSDIDSDLPVVHSLAFNPKSKDELILRAGFEAGALLVDGLGDGIMISTPPIAGFDINLLRQTSFNLLQGCRMRSTKTEFVSCPSCGRKFFAVLY